MDLQIKKRTGELVPFNKEKIETAICKAWHEVYPNEQDKPSYGQEIADMVENVAKELDEYIGVEDIQDVIEKVLEKDYPEVFESYKGYRDRRSASREAFVEKQQHKFVKAIESLGLVKNFEHLMFKIKMQI